MNAIEIGKTKVGSRSTRISYDINTFHPDEMETFSCCPVFNKE